MLKFVAIFLVLVCASTFSLFGQSNFVIKGKIEADFPQMIRIEYLDRSDSIRSENGMFHLKGELAHPALLRLTSRNMLNNRNVSKEVFVEKGEIVIDARYDQLRRTSPVLELNSSQLIFDEYNRKFGMLVDIYRFTRDSLVDKKGDDNVLKGKVKKLYEKIYRFEEMYEKDFIYQNHDNYVGAYFLYRYGIHYMLEGEMDSVLALFPEKIGNSYYLAEVARKHMFAKMLKEGAPVPGVVLQDQKQSEIELGTFFSGKINLIDLWASWCVPCIETHDLLKELHKKYSSAGLNILGISLDSDRSNWLNFLKKRPLPWRNFLDPEGEAGKVNNLFNIVAGNGIPFFILVNEKGEYLKIGLEAEELESYIRSYLKL